MDGSFRLDALPPADYRAVAVDVLPWHAWTDVAVLARLWSSATRFRLGEGEERTVNLRPSPAPAGAQARFAAVMTPLPEIDLIE
jgi:hypothetical protein